MDCLTCPDTSHSLQYYLRALTHRHHGYHRNHGKPRFVSSENLTCMYGQYLSVKKSFPRLYWQAVETEAVRIVFANHTLQIAALHRLHKYRRVVSTSSWNLLRFLHRHSMWFWDSSCRVSYGRNSRRAESLFSWVSLRTSLWRTAIFLFLDSVARKNDTGSTLALAECDRVVAYSA